MTITHILYGRTSTCSDEVKSQGRRVIKCCWCGFACRYNYYFSSYVGVQELESIKRSQKLQASSQSATEVRLNQAREDVQKYKSLLQKAQSDGKVIPPTVFFSCLLLQCFCVSGWTIQSNWQRNYDTCSHARCFHETWFSQSRCLRFLRPRALSVFVPLQLSVWVFTCIRHSCLPTNSIKALKETQRTDLDEENLLPGLTLSSF